MSGKYNVCVRYIKNHPNIPWMEDEIQNKCGLTQGKKAFPVFLLGMNMNIMRNILS